MKPSEAMMRLVQPLIENVVPDEKAGWESELRREGAGRISVIRKSNQNRTS